MRDDFVMGVTRASALVIVALACITGSAHAQNANASSTSDAAAPAWQPPPAITPTQGPGIPLRAPVRPAPPPPPDYRLRDSTMVAEYGIYIAPFAVSTFDNTLGARGIDTSFQWGMDLAGLTRLARFFWLGGRAGFLKRQFDTNSVSVGAFAFELQVTAESRIALNESFELVAHLDVGAAHVGVRYNDVVDAGIVPRASAGLGLSFWAFDDLRGLFRVDYRYLVSQDLNDMGDELNLGGLAVVMGIEWRPTLSSATQDAGATQEAASATGEATQ